MDLTHKLMSFIHKQGQSPKASPTTPPPLDPPLPNHFESPSSVEIEKEAEVRDFPTDPLADQEVLESIDEVYFKSDEFDPSQYELNRVPEVLEEHVINCDRQRILRQLTVVSKKVFQLILQNQSLCTEELKRVTELQKDLHQTLLVCQMGRQQLHLAKRQFTTTSLGILANYRKRQLVLSLLHSLSTIKTLQRTDERLQELLAEEDYPGAIQLLLECQKAAATFGHFACISALSRKLQDTLEMTEEQLDVALSRICGHFDQRSYEKLQTAYRLLGKTQIAMDQLHMHFTSAIHNTAFTVVHGYVELCAVGGANGGMGEANFQKKQYHELCKSVTSESFLPCLIDLCKALWEIMNSYHKTMEWHEKADAEGINEGAEGPEMDFTCRYVRQKLSHGQSRVWQDVQTKVRTYLLSSDLSHFKFEDFLQVLEVVRRLMEVGGEFCGTPKNPSEGSSDSTPSQELLQESLKQQSAAYFHSYHHNCLEELCTFLENEGWEICPLKPNFNLLQLHELKFLHSVLHLPRASLSQANVQVDALPVLPTETSIDGSEGYFVKYSERGSPFDEGYDDTQEEDILVVTVDDPSGYFSEDSDEDIPEELKRDFVDENTGDITPRHPRRHDRLHSRLPLPLPPSGPILTNTTLSVLRLCGKYLRMMRLLRPVASEVVTCLMQLFDYYLYSVCAFFSCGREGLKLRAALNRIQEQMKVPWPHLSPGVDLGRPETLHGLGERLVGAESLVFLAAQFEYVRPYVEEVLPSSASRAMLQQFYTQAVGVAMEVREPVYQAVASKAVDYENVLVLMGRVNWDVKEVMSQHSTYVDVLLRELQIFTMRLEEVSRHTPIPKEAYSVLWKHVIYNTNHILVEGFASTRKCSQGGRALMQLDFIQFVSKLEKITDLRPIPEREFVENYIKAYYLPEAAMEEWLKDHLEYSSKQLVALVMCAHQNNKKSRQRLLTVIEEMDRTKR